MIGQTAENERTESVTRVNASIRADEIRMTTRYLVDAGIR